MDLGSSGSLLSLRSFFETVGLCDAENVFPEGGTLKPDKLRLRILKKVDTGPRRDA
jgi:hypothetical protein